LVAGIHLLNSEDQKEFCRHLKKLSEIIADDHLLDEKFLAFCKGKESVYKVYMEPYRNKLLISLFKRGLLPSFFTKQKRRLHLNIMRCESHRDVLLQILKQDG